MRVQHGDYISRSSALYRDSQEYRNHRRNTMKVFALLIFSAVLAFASVAALPALVHDGLMQKNDEGIIRLEDVDTDGGLAISTELSPVRHRRVTCDLFSLTTPWGGVNHAACAARCLFQKHKGGVCRDGVCHCRG